MEKLTQQYFKVYSSISPRLASKKAFSVFQKVRMKEIRDRERPFYEKAKHFKVKVQLNAIKQEKIDCYSLGHSSNPLVVLVHGWDSNAGSMAAIADSLVKEGYFTISFNLPGHAFYKSNSTNLVECSTVFQGVMEYLSPRKPEVIISHSFGSAVVAHGLSKMDTPIEKLIFLTNPNKIEDIFTAFKNHIGLSEKAYQHLISHTEGLLNDSIKSLAVEENVKNVSVDQLLLIHDQEDKVLPYQNAKQVADAHPSAALITLENVGHYRMLWNDAVIQKCLQFIRIA